MFFGRDQVIQANSAHNSEFVLGTLGGSSKIVRGTGQKYRVKGVTRSKTHQFWFILFSDYGQCCYFSWFSLFLFHLLSPQCVFFFGGGYVPYRWLIFMKQRKYTENQPGLSPKLIFRWVLNNAFMLILLCRWLDRFLLFVVGWLALICHSSQNKAKQNETKQKCKRTNKQTNG